MSGLGALAANYTDSEDEADESGNEEGEREKGSPEPAPHSAGGLLGSLKHLGSPSSVDSGNRPPSSARSTPTKRMRLVSYGADDDAGGGDTSINNEEALKDAGHDEDHSHSRNTAPSGHSDGGDQNEPVDMDLDTGEEEDEDSATAASSDDKKQQLQTQDSKVEAWTEGVSQLPPEPEGICNPSLQKYITELWTRQQETAYDMNAVIQSKKGFRNPSIYDKLIQHCGIDEHGTNFPKELYDGHLFGEESYYDVLAKAQNEMEKKAEARKKEASLRAQPEPKRKSRFDQGQLASSSSSLPSANVAAAQAQAASVAANLPAIGRAASQSAASKTIPAFGLLKKQ